MCWVAGFELLSSENIRLHYVRTLKDWISKMREKKDEICKIVDEKLFRAYMIFWAGSAVSFNKQDMAVYQNLFYKKPKNSNTLAYFSSTYPYAL